MKLPSQAASSKYFIKLTNAFFEKLPKAFPLLGEQEGGFRL